MHPPDNARVFETPISIHWFDEDGIMCAISKQVERTIPHYQKVMELYAQFTECGRKLCLLADASKANQPMSKEVREYMMTEMAKYIKAHAVISKQELSESQNKVFLQLSFTGFPVGLFNTEAEAREWLKKYL